MESTSQSVRKIFCEAILASLHGLALAGLIATPLIVSPRGALAQVEPSTVGEHAGKPNVELESLKASCTVYSSGVVAFNLSGAVTVNGESRSGVVANFLDFAAVPFERGLKEDWSSERWGEWLTKNTTRFHSTTPPEMKNHDVVHFLTVDVYALTGGRPSRGSLSAAVIEAEASCVKVALAVATAGLGNISGNSLRSGGAIQSAVAGPAPGLWEKTKDYWNWFLKSSWGKRVLKWLGIIQIIDFWNNCVTCIEMPHQCNGYQCLFDIISLILSLTPGGRIFALILDLIDILCAFMEETCAAVCEQLGWPRILPACNDILRDRGQTTPESY